MQRCDLLYQIPRDMSWVNLPLCFPCHIFSVAYVKDRRLSGGPGTSSSLFTSNLLLLSCLMTLASWNVFLVNVRNLYNLFWGCCKVIFDFCFNLRQFSFIPMAFNHIFVQSKIFFPSVEKYLSLISFSPTPLLKHFKYCPLHGLQLPFSKGFNRLIFKIM